MDKKHIINLQGKEFVTFPGLLDAAHADGLQKVSTSLLQIPSEENGNTAIVRAEVFTDKGSFTGIGDASPKNVNKMIAAHMIRMAETRAIARAFRFATNCAYTAKEELGGDDKPEQNSDKPSGGNGQYPDYVKKADLLEGVGALEEKVLEENLRGLAREGFCGKGELKDFTVKELKDYGNQLHTEQKKAS